MDSDFRTTKIRGHQLFDNSVIATLRFPFAFFDAKLPTPP